MILFWKWKVDVCVWIFTEQVFIKARPASPFSIVNWLGSCVQKTCPVRPSFMLFVIFADQKPVSRSLHVLSPSTNTRVESKCHQVELETKFRTKIQRAHQWWRIDSGQGFHPAQDFVGQPHSFPRCLDTSVSNCDQLTGPHVLNKQRAFFFSCCPPLGFWLIRDPHQPVDEIGSPICRSADKIGKRYSAAAA